MADIVWRVAASGITYSEAGTWELRPDANGTYDVFDDDRDVAGGLDLADAMQWAEREQREKDDHADARAWNDLEARKRGWIGDDA